MKKLILYAVLALMLAACAAPKTITVTEYRDLVRFDTVTVESDRVDSTYKAHYL